MYHFLLGHKTRGFSETTTEILFSAAKTGELFLLLCPKEEMFEKFKCCSLFLFSLPLEGRNNVVTTVTYHVLLYVIIQFANSIICIYEREIIERRCGLIHDDKQLL